MIGVNNSPLNMFTGGGNDAFNRGMVIGDANSPFSPVAAAFKDTLDKYNAHLDAQQQQAYKLDQIQAEGTAGLGKEQAIIDYKNNAETKKAAAINTANATMPNSGVREVNIDGRKVFLKDSVNNSGINESSAIQPAPHLTMDQLIEQKVQDQMAPNPVATAPIQQGAGGAVADSTGAQNLIRVKNIASGLTGTVPANEYDPSIYAKIQ